jgi:hypothetical protein
VGCEGQWFSASTDAALNRDHQQSIFSVSTDSPSGLGLIRIKLAQSAGPKIADRDRNMSHLAGVCSCSFGFHVTAIRAHLLLAKP